MNIRPFRRGPLGQASISEILRAQLEIERQARLCIGPGFGLHDFPGRILVDERPEFFWAKIDSGTQPYAWTEVRETAAGTFAATSDSRSGTTTDNPAYEQNACATVPANVIVWMRRSRFGEHYVFEFATGATTTVTLSGTVNITTTLIIPYLGSDPGSPTNGQVWINSGDCTLRYWCGGSTHTVSTGGTTVYDETGTTQNSPGDDLIAESGLTAAMYALTVSNEGVSNDLTVDFEILDKDGSTQSLNSSGVVNPGTCKQVLIAVPDTIPVLYAPITGITVAVWSTVNGSHTDYRVTGGRRGG